MMRVDLDMTFHDDINQMQLIKLIKDGVITLGGNSKLKIYGQLNCASGKRMKRANRIFFSNEAEAIQRGFRPCGRCLREQYREWKRSSTF